MRFHRFSLNSWHALGLLEGNPFWSKTNRWYGEISGDVYFLANHDYSRVNLGISAFIFGPFYLVLAFAFAKGANWIRIPAFIYVGAMLHGMSEWVVWQYFIGPPPTETLIFWAFNGAYAAIPVLLAIRMWKPEPFGSS